MRKYLLTNVPFNRAWRCILALLALSLAASGGAFASANGARKMPAADIVTGKVTSPSGESIPGVNVILKGTNLGTVTDVDGKYSIEVPDLDGILVFTYIGFSTEEVAINGRTNIDVSLAETSHNLDEVVVVGYSTQKTPDS